jgi:hypothetical protein
MKQNKKILDHLMALTKAGIAAAPIWGGPIVSLINDYVPSARQKSLEEAFRLLKLKLESIENRIDVETVKKDEFVELYNSCLLIIVRTRQILKLNAAVSLITNILLKEDDPEKLSYTELDHFARCLESLSIGAIKTLGHAVDIAKQTDFQKIGYQPIRFDFKQLQDTMQEADPYLLMGLVGELNSLNLLHMAGAPQIPLEGYANYPLQLTPLGARFVERLLQEETK